MTDYIERRNIALALMQKVHTGSIRGNGTVPDWHHLDRVSRVLEMVLADTGEGSVDEREMISLAALGHDALEDTHATRPELVAVFGDRGVALIDGMTNTFGDDHPTAYVAQVVSAEEGVRLIKLSDLYDNCTGVTHELFVKGAAWCEGYFLPIVEPMMDAILPSTFVTYPNAALRLKGMVRIARANLHDEVARFKAAARERS